LRLLASGEKCTAWPDTASPIVHDPGAVRFDGAMCVRV
jgi:hypothetical protein